MFWWFWNVLVVLECPGSPVPRHPNHDRTSQPPPATSPEPRPHHPQPRHVTRPPPPHPPGHRHVTRTTTTRPTPQPPATPPEPRPHPPPPQAPAAFTRHHHFRATPPEPRPHPPPQPPRGPSAPPTKTPPHSANDCFVIEQNTYCLLLFGFVASLSIIFLWAKILPVLLKTSAISWPPAGDVTSGFRFFLWAKPLPVLLKTSANLGRPRATSLPPRVPGARPGRIRGGWSYLQQQKNEPLICKKKLSATKRIEPRSHVFTGTSATSEPFTRRATSGFTSGVRIHTKCGLASYTRHVTIDY